MDKTLKRASKKRRMGNATVEFLLLMPLIISMIGYSNILGSMSRIYTYSSSVGDDMLRYGTGSYESLVSKRAGGEILADSADVKKMWQLNHPSKDGSTGLDIRLPSGIYSQDNSYFATLDPDDSSESLSYSDPIDLAKQAQFMKVDRGVQQEDGSILWTEDLDPELVYLITRLEEDPNAQEYFSAADMLDQRSLNHSLALEFELNPWMNTRIFSDRSDSTSGSDHDLQNDSQDIFPSTYTSNTYRHMKNPGYGSDTFQYTTSDAFHAELNFFFQSSFGEVSATLAEPDQSTWSSYQNYRKNESLSGN